MANLAQLETHYTLAEVAKEWKMGLSTVRRIFRDRTDVLKISGPRGRVVVRIPASTLDRIQREGRR